jgi:hypothetical protein
MLLTVKILDAILKKLLEWNNCYPKERIYFLNFKDRTLTYFHYSPSQRFPWIPGSNIRQRGFMVPFLMNVILP